MGDAHGRPAPQTLRDYALLADGERGALIGLHGEIVWMCAPRWDSGAVFGDLVGGPGHYTVAPRGRFVGGGHYEPGTLVWRSRWTTSGASPSAVRRWRSRATRTGPCCSGASRPCRGTPASTCGSSPRPTSAGAARPRSTWRRACG
ncbi:DUF5911 domain-containing protein, partial [Nocardiopsis tropica]|nr:DUF5911 domain-containing protein [Nocardiopsis tropica]